MNSKRLVFQLAATYVGAIVGAGFASGQELMQFFVIFDYKGLMGVFLSGILFAGLGSMISIMVIKYRIKGYQQLLVRILGKKIGFIVDLWITVSIFIGLGIMLAGCSAVFQEKLFLNYNVGLVLSSVIVLLALLKGEQGVLAINTFLIPLLIIATITVCVMSIGIKHQEVYIAGSNPLVGKNWLLALALYVSYNMVTSIVILTSMDYHKLKAGIVGIWLGGFLLGAIGLIMVYAMQLYRPQVLIIEIPMLYLTEYLNFKLSWLYALAMLSAMLTTAVANAFGLITRLEPLINMNKDILALLVLVLAIPISHLGFGKLIGHFYPLFGYVGVVIIIAIIIKQAKMSWRS